MQRWQAGIAVTGGVMALAALWWLPSALQAPSPGLEPAASQPRAAPPADEHEAHAPAVAHKEAPASDGEPPRPAAEGPHHAHSQDAPADASGDLAFYADYPMSEVPHFVVWGWGAGPASASPGRVGAFVIVEPGISDEALTQLASDIQRFHRGADAVSVRILDDEAAATYDRHTDGGEFLAAHLVGRVQRSGALGLETIQIRGEEIVDF